MGGGHPAPPHPFILQICVLGLLVREYKFAVSRQLLQRLQRMAQVLPVAILVSLLAVKDKKYSRNMCISFGRPTKQ